MTDTAAAPPGAQRTSPYAWVVLAMLAFIYIFNFLDRQLMSTVLESIKRDTGFTDADMGYMTGFWFALVYTTFGVVVGFLADRTSRRNILFVGATLWSGFTAMCGLSQNYTTLLLSRVGVGVGEAAGAPPSYSIISDYFPAEKRGIALALFFIPLTSIILGGLPGDKIASASGLSSFCRVLFGSFGTSISVTVWQDRTALHHAQLTEMINRGSTASNSALAGLNAAGLSAEQAFSQINRMIDQQAGGQRPAEIGYRGADGQPAEHLLELRRVAGRAPHMALQGDRRGARGAARHERAEAQHGKHRKDHRQGRAAQQFQRAGNPRQTRHAADGDHQRPAAWLRVRSMASSRVAASPAGSVAESRSAISRVLMDDGVSRTGHSPGSTPCAKTGRSSRRLSPSRRGAM